MNFSTVRVSGATGSLSPSSTAPHPPCPPSSLNSPSAPMPSRPRRPETANRIGHPAMLDRRAHHRRLAQTVHPQPFADLRALCRLRTATLYQRLDALTAAGRIVKSADSYSPNPEYLLPVPASRSLYRAREALAGSPSKSLAGEPSKCAVTLKPQASSDPDQLICYAVVTLGDLL
jgi:hypothetical protein